MCMQKELSHAPQLEDSVALQQPWEVGRLGGGATIEWGGHLPKGVEWTYTEFSF